MSKFRGHLWAVLIGSGVLAAIIGSSVTGIFDTALSIIQRNNDYNSAITVLRGQLSSLVKADLEQEWPAQIKVSWAELKSAGNWDALIAATAGVSKRAAQNQSRAETNAAKVEASANDITKKSPDGGSSFAPIAASILTFASSTESVFSTYHGQLEAGQRLLTAAQENGESFETAKSALLGKWKEAVAIARDEVMPLAIDLIECFDGELGNLVEDGILSSKNPCKELSDAWKGMPEKIHLAGSTADIFGSQ